MSAAVLQKMLRAREQVVEAGGFKFTVRRPTDVDMMALSGMGGVDRVFKFVIGWSGVRELDLIPGGDGAAVEFSPELCREWLCDRPDLAAPLVEQILGSYKTHAEAIEAAIKN